jgi:hypothetical protein
VTQIRKTWIEIDVDELTEILKEKFNVPDIANFEYDNYDGVTITWEEDV